jgi:hypothetical protein
MTKIDVLKRLFPVMETLTETFPCHMLTMSADGQSLYPDYVPLTFEYEIVSADYDTYFFHFSIRKITDGPKLNKKALGRIFRETLIERVMNYLHLTANFVHFIPTAS